jgi:hypothetical protein
MSADSDFAIEFAARSISGIYGMLDDLPEELANTVANQYVAVALLMTDLTQTHLLKRQGYLSLAPAEVKFPCPAD